MAGARDAAVLAWRQLTHRGVKLLAALAGASVAIVLMFMQVGFMNALYDSARAIPSSLAADLVLTSRDFRTMSYTPPWIPRSLVDLARGDPAVAEAVPVYAMNLSVRTAGWQGLMPAWLLGVPPHAQAFRRADIQSQLPAVAQPNRFLLDQLSRGGFRQVAGQVRREGTASFVVPLAAATVHYTGEVAGVFSLGPTFSIDGTLITSDLNFLRLTGQPLDRVSLAVLRLAPDADAPAVQRRLAATLGGGAKVLTRAQFLEQERHYFAHETPIGYIFGVGLVVGVVVGVVFILQALHGIISDNLREYAVLRAMGCGDRFFAWLVGGMALAFTLAAYLPSVLLSAWLYRVAASATQLPLRMNAADMLAILGVVLLMGTAATAVALRKLRKANPVDLFG